jgi:anti-sigma regulatory factor (Ser/Thr protein kinase)
MERSFKRDLSSLADVFAFVEECLSTVNVDAASQYSVALSAEELFTNMVKYNPMGTKDISIAIATYPRAVKITMIDQGALPFDVTKQKELDIAPLEERKVGGLGLHLVRSLMDSITYTFDDGRSTITCTKNLER